MLAGEGLVALTDQEVAKLQLHRSNRAWKEPSKHIYVAVQVGPTGPDRHLC